MSLNNFHVANEYTKNILWHGMEYFLRFLPAHLKRLACSPTHMLMSLFTFQPPSFFLLWISQKSTSLHFSYWLWIKSGIAFKKVFVFLFCVCTLLNLFSTL
jgi:hypothetical protein